MNTQCYRTIITVIGTHYPCALGYSSPLGACCSHHLSEADVEVVLTKNRGKTSQQGKIHFYHTALRESEKFKSTLLSKLWRRAAEALGDWHMEFQALIS